MRGVGAGRCDVINRRALRKVVRSLTGVVTWGVLSGGTGVGIGMLFIHGLAKLGWVAVALLGAVLLVSLGVVLYRIESGVK